MQEQDTLEDYIQISHNIQTDSEIQETIRKEALVTREKQVQSNNYAQKIVELLLDGKFESQILLKCLNYINQEHYQDIVEERVLLNICGYALCGNMLSKIPTEQYYISTKHKKVYDISERKNFCSNYCYQASDYIKKQIDNSPIWLRKREDSMQFKLLPMNYVARPGIEVNDDNETVDKEKEFTSANSYTEHFLNNTDESTILKFPESYIISDLKDTTKLERNCSVKRQAPKGNETAVNDGIKHKKKVRFDSNILIDTIPNEEIYEPEISNGFEDLNNSIDQLCKSMNIKLETGKSKKPIKNPKTIVSPKINDKDIKQVIMKINASKKNELRNSILINTELNPEIKEMNRNEKMPKYSQRIMKLMNNSEKHQIIDNTTTLKKLENNSINTINVSNKNENDMLKSIEVNHNPNFPCYIEIDNKIELNKQKDYAIIQPIEKSFLKWITLDTYIYLYGEEKIKEILSKEKLETYFDKLGLEESQTANQLRYMNICKQMQLQELAERKFDNAILEKKLKPLPNYNNLKVASKQMDLKVKSFFSGSMYEEKNSKGRLKTNMTNNENIVPTPVIQAASQTALRKKIFINSLSKYIKTHVHEMDLEEHVLNDVISMIKTFKMEANNIMFKPSTWNAIAIILLIILSFKDETLFIKLNSFERQRYVNEKLYKIDGSSELVNIIMNAIKNVDIYVEQFITQS